MPKSRGGKKRDHTFYHESKELEKTTSMCLLGVYLNRLSNDSFFSLLILI